MGSRPGSKNSSISSIKTGFPLEQAYPRVRYRFGVDYFKIMMSFYFSRFLIHLLAYCCGSIMRGHLDDLVARIPFSTETVSVGSP